MATLPPDVIDLLRDPKSYKTMSTVGEDGSPHSVVCGTLLVPDEHTVAVGVIYLRTTGENLGRNPSAEFLVSRGKEAYSVSCKFRGPSDDGSLIAEMNLRLDRIGARVGTVWLFDVEGVRDEGLTYTSGMKIARVRQK